ncbi:PTS sugar transporter subunit IIA [Anaerobium acetethylicum]|uniref:PTS system, beta-glucosides-specific IIC component n=1 Tax=Anaerobium acetethylicum TaxID=1619234 RepID=A0A1D3TTG2_9FIRM|nr:PTS glucose transporter subunit IIA [Anaerobium acetethylicum]SCP97277.1 PTS system, beta-glucosides-specific IIC component [Anaerobium acetethylicum]
MIDILKGLFGNKKGVIQSPIEGKAVPISTVSDPTFGEEILGKGIAIQPAKGRVVSPVDGTVALMFDTKHAVSIVSDDGAEILIHIGLDTVKLKGKHFTAHAKADDKVKAGDLLLEFDIDKIAAEGYDVIAPVIICNTSDYATIDTVTGKNVKERDRIMVLKK